MVNTYSERFRKPGAEVVEDYGDDVLVGDVHVARLKVHLSGSHQIQGILKRHLWDQNKTIGKVKIILFLLFSSSGEKLYTRPSGGHMQTVKLSNQSGQT